MNIQHSLNGNEGIFFIEQQGEKIAQMVYKQRNENTIIITHTEVKEEYEGKGVGQSLVEEAVNYARKNSIKIKAACVFAKSILQHNNEYHDVYIH